MPIFPQGYERFVKKPIEATITKILRREIRKEQGYDGSPSYDSHTLVRLRQTALNVG